MTRPLTNAEMLAIENARWAVQRLVSETPDSLHGDTLVRALLVFLSADADMRKNAMGSIGIAAAAIAELVERERGERSVVA